MQKLKVINSKMRNTEPEKFSNLCQSKCNFLYTNYTDIYHKNFKDELNLQLMANLLEILRKIENGEVINMKVLSWLEKSKRNICR